MEAQTLEEEGMKTVSELWKSFTLFLIGAIAGVIGAVKFLIPTPSQDVNVDKVVVRGKGNTVTDGLDINKADQVTETKTKKKLRIFNKKNK